MFSFDDDNDLFKNDPFLLNDLSSLPEPKELQTQNSKPFSKALENKSSISNYLDILQQETTRFPNTLVTPHVPQPSFYEQTGLLGDESLFDAKLISGVPTSTFLNFPVNTTQQQNTQQTQIQQQQVIQQAIRQQNQQQLSKVTQNENTQSTNSKVENAEKPKEVKKEEESSKPQIPETVPQIITGTDMELCIKPARKTGKYFINYFPNKLYCSPYKYDILVKIPTTLYQSYKLVFRFIDAETGKKIKTNQKGKTAVYIEKTRTTHNAEGQTEILCRVCFTVCSFHHYRRAFIFSALLKPKLKDEKSPLIKIFESQPFHTYARKSNKESDMWASDEDDSSSKKRKKRKRKSSKKKDSPSKKKKKSNPEESLEKLTSPILDKKLWSNSSKQEINKLLSGYSNDQSDSAFSNLDSLM